MLSPSSIGEIVGLAIACGAAETGGPLSRSESALVQTAASVGVIAGRRIRTEIREGGDPLGDALCSIRSPLERRPLGAFYTRPTIVEPMVEWAFEQNPTRFVDPGCGSGRFSVAAAARQRSLSIVAIDLDPVATLLTRAALAAVGAKNARVLNADYLTVDIPQVDGRSAFVANPPYVRHHDIDAQTKAHATMLALSVGHKVSGLAGLHALFYLATLAKHGRKGDFGAFVTSSEWLDVGYGSVIRSMFTNGLGGRSLTVYDPQGVPFDDAMTTATIATFCIGEEPRIARLRRVAGGGRAIRLEYRGRAVERDLLARTERWSPLVDGATEGDLSQTIGTLFRVSRGQVTGCNEYFVMPRSRAAELGIGKFCVPLICSAEEVFESAGVVRNNEQRMVGLQVPKDYDLSQHAALAAYIRAGEARGVHLGYVASHRKPWYSLAFSAPPIIATYMARQAPVFARNPDGLGLLNVAHGLYPRQPLNDEALDAIVARLNRTRRQFVGRGRTYHGGLEKFEPREMERLPLRVAL